MALSIATLVFQHPRPMEPPMHRVSTRTFPAMNRSLLIVPSILTKRQIQTAITNKMPCIICPRFIPAVWVAFDVHVPLGTGADVRGVVEVDIPSFGVFYDDCSEEIARARVDCEAVGALVHEPRVASVLLEKKDLEGHFRFLLHADAADSDVTVNHERGNVHARRGGVAHDAALRNVASGLLGVAFFRSMHHGSGRDGGVLVVYIESVPLEYGQHVYTMMISRSESRTGDESTEIWTGFLV
jgi:hypothetical protein